MEIINVRVDERLIHAQIILSWINYLDVNRIMVIDDEVVENDQQKQILKLACPPRVKLSILNVEVATVRFKEDAYVGDRVLVICKNIDTVKRLVKNGCQFSEVNISNLSCNTKGIQLKSSVCLDEKDIENLKYLNDQSIKIVSLATPSDTNVDIINAINNQ